MVRLGDPDEEPVLERADGVAVSAELGAAVRRVRTEADGLVLDEAGDVGVAVEARTEVDLVVRLRCKVRHAAERVADGGPRGGDESALELLVGESGVAAHVTPCRGYRQ